MSNARELVFFHAPNTRSISARILLEELDVPHRLHVLNMRAGEQRLPAFLAVNPMGKVPAILDGEVLVTEQVAIFLYLADRFPAAGLAPAIDDPQRGAYLRWLVFYAACFEPAVLDKALHREAPPQQMSPYGSYDSVMATLAERLRVGPYLLGERFSAADILWGSALGWTMAFELVPAKPEFIAYVTRFRERPAAVKVKAADAALDAEHAAAVDPDAAAAG